MNHLQGQDQKDTLIYIGDPLCSWCYGFSPELDQIKAAFPAVAFEMVMGGLRPGGNESMTDLKDFLSHHWQEVQKATGQAFNYTILKNKYIIYDTEPACRAVMVANKLKPGVGYEYFKAVQHSFYVLNTSPSEVDVYVQLAQSFDIDPEKFHILYKSDQSKQDIYAEFDLANSLGATGFPTLIAKIKGKLYLVTSGYTKASKIISLLKARGMEP